LEHLLHSPYEKSLVERANEYLKDRIEESTTTTRASSLDAG